MRLFIVISLIFSSSLLAENIDSFEARNAPIADFVSWVSKQTGLNIVLGAGVEGNVSVHVNSMKDDDLIFFFEQVMNSYGYSVVRDKNVYKVLLSSNVKLDHAYLLTRVYRLNHIRNTKAKSVIESYLSTTFHKETKKSDFQYNNTFVVVLMPTENSLMVSMTLEQERMISDFINDLDRPARQLMIEAVIMETDLGDQKEVGVNLATVLMQNGFSLVSNTSLAVDMPTRLLGGYTVYSSDGDLRGFVKTMSKSTDVKILSTPTIVVLDRERGYISVGQNVPFLISKETLNNGSTVQQIERRDVGVTLSVLPHVLDAENIIFDISQESSSVTSSTQAADIITNKRSINTVARVKAGQTLSLGGLISEEDRLTETGVPLLKDLPLLGGLFKTTKNDKVQRELTVLIKTNLL